MLLNIIDKNCAKMLLFLTSSPGRKYNRKEIKDFIEMNNVPLDNSLNILISLRMIEENRHIYSLNLENLLVKVIMEERKEMDNLPLKVQFILIDFVREVLRMKDIKDVILFGSYAKLVFNVSSDIDLAVIIDNGVKSKMDMERKFSFFIKKLEKKYKKDIHLSLFSERDLKHKEDPLIKDVLRNGRRLLFPNKV